MHLGLGSVFRVNIAGAKIWAQLAAGSTVDTITQKLSQEYGVIEETIRRDMGNFIDELLERSMVNEITA